MARINNYILNYTKILAIFYFNYKLSLGEQDFFQVYTHTTRIRIKYNITSVEQ